MSQKAGIIVAMDVELRALEKAGVKGAVKSGIGKVNAARAATELILTGKPDFIINSGCAGGMDSRLSVGDFVVGSQCAWHDVWCGGSNPIGLVEGMPQRFDADPFLLSAASRLPGNPVQGLLVSGDQFYISQEEDSRIAALYPDVLAADMESAAVAQICHYYKVPFISFRAISDVHTSDKVQAETYEAFWKNIADSSFRLLMEYLSILA